MQPRKSWCRYPFLNGKLISVDDGASATEPYQYRRIPVQNNVRLNWPSFKCDRGSLYELHLYESSSVFGYNLCKNDIPQTKRSKVSVSLEGPTNLYLSGR